MNHFAAKDISLDLKIDQRGFGINLEKSTGKRMKLGNLKNLIDAIKNEVEEHKKPLSYFSWRYWYFRQGYL